MILSKTFEIRRLTIRNKVISKYFHIYNYRQKVSPMLDLPLLVFTWLVQLLDLLDSLIENRSFWAYLNRKM